MQEIWETVKSVENRLFSEQALIRRSNPEVARQLSPKTCETTHRTTGRSQW